MLALRPMAAADVAVIKNWPAYPPEFEELDYALRSHGWMDEYLNNPDAWLYIAEQAGEIIAFTILAKTSAAEVEFRIALRPDKIGEGLGRAVTTLTLEKVLEMQLACVHLIVRKSNARAIGLYKSHGFTECGECVLQVNGKLVNFLNMALTMRTYAENICDQQI